MILNNNLYIILFNSLKIMIIQRRYKAKLTLVIVSSIIFLIGFVINIVEDSGIYSVDLDYIPRLQNSVSSGFITFMNVVSYVFTPTYCAGYLALIWLFSSKKMQILGFILWFIFWNWLNSIIKISMQQPRPYWIQGSGIQMLYWHCDSDYGCPSGHSMMGLLFFQFLVRLTVRSFTGARKIIWLLYILMVSLQVLLMFSRVILGMHSINQVLMGAMISMYGIFMYYSYLETLILKYLAILSMTKRKAWHLMIIIAVLILVYGLQLILLFLPTYNDAAYLMVIKATPGCSHAKDSNSFQYNCFEGTDIVMVNFGALIALLFMQNPQIFTKTLQYSIISWKFLFRYIILGVAAMIPIGIFYLNHAWDKIESDTIGKTFIKWSTQSVGFFFTSVMIFFVGIPISKRLQLQIYGQCEYIQILESSKSELKINSESQIELTPESSKQKK